MRKTKSGKKYEELVLPNLGLIKTKFTDEELRPLLDDIETMKLDFETAKNKYEVFNKKLAGNIRKEFGVSPATHKHMAELLNPFFMEYFKLHPHMIPDEIKMTHRANLDSIWVNFQEKHEFNPPHVHSGLCSFVIWIKVPYDIKELQKISPGVKSNIPSAGVFNILYNDILGQQRQFPVEADSKYENTMLLFPAQMIHMVNPFYGTDDYRISVSGNFIPIPM